MKERPQTGFTLHSTSISAQHKNGSKMQMKKSQTSERKNTQMSLIFHLFFLCLILSMTSCAGKSDYHFKDSYFDYEEMGFGEVITSHDDLVEVIIDYVNNDCAMKEEYIKKVENFFKFIDKNNCKRVYESIKKL